MGINLRPRMIFAKERNASIIAGLAGTSLAKEVPDEVDDEGEFNEEEQEDVDEELGDNEEEGIIEDD